MKKKDLKKLATKIAQFEYVIQNSTDKKEKNDAMNNIIKLSSNHAISIEDMEELDILVQEILASKTIS